jgi:ABC-type nitrate/sulfonate/bicarbonate transport system permease component
MDAAAIEVAECHCDGIDTFDRAHFCTSTLLSQSSMGGGGFSADHQSLVLTTRYVPTVCVVVLSLAWKMLVSDLKKITPWASLTKRWRAAEDSILLDYVDDLEILSLWKSCRRRHWGLFLAILGGLILGLSTFFFDVFVLCRSFFRLLQICVV